MDNYEVKIMRVNDDPDSQVTIMFSRNGQPTCMPTFNVEGFLCVQEAIEKFIKNNPDLFN